MNRLDAVMLFLLAAQLPAGSRAADEFWPQTGHIWLAGAFSISDELGGFSIRSVSGSGDRDDPILVVQEFPSARAVTLVIRALSPGTPFSASGITDRNIIHMRIETLNASGIPWIEFEFELQKEFSLPSVFGDGLSFDQVRHDREGVSSDSFVQFHDDFEPYDRLRFYQGHVDPLGVVQFRFVITDFNPREIFYLRQDPRIPLG